MIIITQVLRVMLAALLFRIRVSIIDVAIEVDHRKTLRPLAFLILMNKIALAQSLKIHKNVS